MLIAQISDTHISVPGKKAYSVASMADNLTHCVEHINQLTPRPDVVLITGDITYSDHPDEYRYAAELLTPLGMPWFVIPGNHDSRGNLKNCFDQVNCPVTSQILENDFINYVIEEFPLRLIALDSTRSKHPGGEFCDARAVWLEQQLDAAADRPTMIFTHHPPVKMGVRETDIDGFIGAERLAAIIEKYHCVEQLICGHVHLPMFTRWHGSIVSAAPSIGLHLRLDLTLQHPSQFCLDAPAFQLHHWTADSHLVTHTISLGAISGPHPF